MLVQVPSKERRPLPREAYLNLEKLLDLCFSGKPSGVLDWAEDMATLGRESQKAFMASALQILRQYYMVFLGLPSLAFLDAGGFENWAAEYGFDPDSRKAESIYRLCLEYALAMRAALGDSGMAELCNAFQDY